MKKIISIILCIIIVLLIIIWVNYKNYQAEQNWIKRENLEYEQYLNRQITGIDITTIINKAVDSNEKNSIPKDEQGFYIQNDIDSITIEINMIDNDTTYKMETIYQGGMQEFIQYYNEILFECSKVEYNKKGKISYIVFEQKTT